MKIVLLNQLLLWEPSLCPPILFSEEERIGPQRCPRVNPQNLLPYMVKGTLQVWLGTLRCGDDPGLTRRAQCNPRVLQGVHRRHRDSKEDVTMEERQRGKQWRKRPRARECGRRKGKETDSSPGSAEEQTLTSTMVLAQWDPVQISDLLNWKIIKLCRANH